MARPLFSHPMVFKEPFDARNAVYRWGASPPADPTVLPRGAVARNATTLAATTILYLNIRDVTGNNYQDPLAGARGGTGQGQSDLIVIADSQTIARFRITAMPTLLAGGTVYALTVALVAVQGVDPPTAGKLTLVVLSYVAIS